MTVSSGQSVGATDRPTICVDLDGTLVAADLMWESLLLLLKRAPLAALMVPLWLLRGRAHLKRQIASHAVPDPRTLPYREDVLAYLHRCRSEGRALVMATAADEIHARAIAAHLGIFSDVLASDGRSNLSGLAKATRLTERFGARHFDYLGNDWVDVPSWSAAGRAIVVAGPARLLHYLRRRIHVESVLAPRPSLWGPVARALRPHQWVKNLLVFVPLVGAHRILDTAALTATVFALLAFCLCASGIYVINDLLDIHADRQHPRKRHRPFASGQLSVPAGSAMSAALITASFAVAWVAGSWGLALVLLLYVATTTLYSVRFKREPVTDVFVLAGLYVLRIVGGAVAASIVLTTWLLAFALFLFLSLAFVKRYTEIAANGGAMPGRGYTAQDALWMHGVGTSAGYMAVLVLALYVNAPEVSTLYSQPLVLWLLCPVLLYWLSRVWFRAGRALADDDPVVDALRDPATYLIGAICAVVLVIAV